MTPDWNEKYFDQTLIHEGSERVYRDFFENSPKGIFQTSPDGHYLNVNQALARIYGYESPGDLMAALTDIAGQLYVRHGRREDFTRQLQSKDVLEDFESEVYRQDGSVIWIAEHARAVRDESGALLYYEGFVDDITSRKRNELRLSVQYAVTRALSETPALEEAMPKVLESICKCLGWSVGTFWKMDYAGYVLRHFSTWNAPCDEAEPFIAADREISLACRVRLPARVWSSTKSIWIPDITFDEDPRRPLAVAAGLRSAFLFPVARGGEIFGIIEFFNAEIASPDHELLLMMSAIGSQIGRFIEVKRAEESLALRHNVIEEMSQGVVISDHSQPDHPVIYCNPAFEKLTGYSRDEILGRNCRFMQGPDTDPAAITKIRDAIRSERPCLTEIINYRKDGSSFWNALMISPVCDEHGDVTRFVGVQTDVTEIKLLQQQFQQSQKMEAFGQLAGGVAHDFNNILFAILGYSEMVMNLLEEENDLRKYVEEIFRSGKRAEALTRQLLAFSRKQTLKPKILDLRSVVGDIQKMLRRLIGEHIELHTISTGAPGSVKADPGQIEQMIVNLVVNARDAMPEGGAITINTTNISFALHDSTRPSSVPPGNYVVLSVADTGVGMSGEVKARIFEPFFTTKEKGKGTGLGLATCYGIVQQSEGFITVESEVGRGATFRIYLRQVDAGPAILENDVKQKNLPRGTETVLVLEDDPAVLEITTTLLTDLGYTVLKAENGIEAQGVVRENAGHKIDLLLADIVMPKMGGMEFADWLAANNPDTRVLFTSGYTEDEVVRRDVLQSRAAFVQKPATLGAIAAKVREVLDA